MNSLEKFEVELLKKLYKLSRELEESFNTNSKFDENKLSQFIALLGQAEFSESIAMQKLAEIPQHLHPTMSYRHFLNFVIPVERLLNKNIAEDEFLISSTDKVETNFRRFPLYFVLDNIRSSFNVGAIFRLADGLGVSEILLCGYTPQPEAKTALGTESVVPFSQWTRLEDTLNHLRQKNISIVALETAENSQELTAWEPQLPTAIIVGNERFGLEASSIRLCDQLVKLPLFGKKNSLNVTHALAIAGYEWQRQFLAKEKSQA